MKYRLLLVALVITFSVSVNAQDFRGMDKSPMDMAYLPDNFSHDRKFAPERKLGDSPIIRVIYSRPQKKGREVFGGMIKYDEIWRIGANEETEIQLYQDITIDGKSLKKGTYAMFVIPSEKEWTIIFNSDLDQWGHYSYNQDLDVLRVKATVKTGDEVVEAMAIQFEDMGNGKAVMRIAWDTTIAETSIEY